MRILGAAAMLIMMMAVPAGAGAAVRLGPDVTQPLPSGGFHLGATGCTQAPEYNPCSFVNLRSTNPDALVAAPAAGVITSWTFRAGCCTDPQTVSHRLTLATFRLGAQDGLSGYGYAVEVLEGPSFELPPGNVLTADAPTTLPARLPIAAGERIGAKADYPMGMSVNDTVPAIQYASLTHGTVYNGEQYGTVTNAALQLSALVEPDADHDGYGDETQDCKPADPAAHDGCAPPPPTPIVNPPSVGIICSPGCPPGVGGGGGGGASSMSPPVPPRAGPIAPPSNPNSVYISLTCPPGLTQPCGGYLIIVPEGGKKAAAARTRYVIASGATRRVKVPLTAKLRKQLRRTGRVKVTLRVQPDGGPATTLTRTIKVKRKRR